MRVFIALLVASFIFATANAQEEENESVAQTLKDLGTSEGLRQRSDWLVDALADMRVAWVLVVTRIDRQTEELDRHLVMPAHYTSWEHCRAAADFVSTETSTYKRVTGRERSLYGYPDTGVNYDCVPFLVEK